MTVEKRKNKSYKLALLLGFFIALFVASAENPDTLAQDENSTALPPCTTGIVCPCAHGVVGSGDALMFQVKGSVETSRPYVVD